MLIKECQVKSKQDKYKGNHTHTHHSQPAENLGETEMQEHEE